jgi:hypothetical protein
MALLQRAVVSRKTLLDGKLEVSDATAARLGGSGASVRIAVDGALPESDTAMASATVTEIRCECARARQTGVHRHRFLESERFRSLAVDTHLDLDLDSDGVVHVSRSAR